MLEGVPLSTYCTGMFDIFFFFLIFFLYEVLRVKTREHLVPLFDKQGNKVFPCLTKKGTRCSLVLKGGSIYYEQCPRMYFLFKSPILELS